MYKFSYYENISVKGSEPLLNCNNVNDLSSEYLISNYFYNLYKPFKNKLIINELDKIFEYSKKINKIKKYADTINSNSWLNYKVLNNITINNMSESIIKNNVSINNISDNTSFSYIQNNKNTTINIENKTLSNTKLKPLFNVKQNINSSNENILYLHKECNCSNEIEYLYTLLNCLFSSNTNYYIKLCKRCNRYFLATLPNKQMCNRLRTICGTSTICCNASKVFYKSKEYKCMFRIIENHLKPYYDNINYGGNTDSEYINNIRDTFRNIKEKCIKEDRYDSINKCLEETKKLINKNT